MTKKPYISENEYIYASARIHALELELLGRDKLERLLDAPTSDAALRLLAEYGYRTPAATEEGEAPGIESAFHEMRMRTLELVEKLAPEPQIFNVFRYPDDCTNIKSAIKCRYRREFSPEELYIDGGTVSKEAIKLFFREGITESFPENMAKATSEAVELYEKTKNPSLIDITLDKACYADMLACAEKFGDEVITDALRMKITLLNITMAMRVKAMGKAMQYFKGIFIEGGAFDLDKFEILFDGGEAAFSVLLSGTPYEKLQLASAETRTPSELEIAADNIYSALIDNYGDSSFGSGALVGYIRAKEIEEKNIRIILAGKSAGIQTEKIRERMRA